VQVAANIIDAEQVFRHQETEDKAMKLNLFPAASTSAIALYLLFSFGLAVPARAQFSPETKLSVGVFSRGYVVQAFYRSAAWNAKLQAMIDQRNKAVTDGDGAKLDAIDRELNTMQTLAQRQLSGEASLKNILDQLAPQWTEIAKEADVDVIVESPVFITPDAGVTDVTRFIVKRLSAR
jgi:Skp family chaperone for outer membrane proteins